MNVRIYVVFRFYGFRQFLTESAETISSYYANLNKNYKEVLKKVSNVDKSN